MAYCPPELLDDLADLLADVRTWADVIEKRPFVFYVRREPFLHFHLLADRRRRGDVKGRTNWVQLDLPRPITATRRSAFLGVLRMCYDEKLERKSGVTHRLPNYAVHRTGRSRCSRSGR